MLAFFLLPFFAVAKARRPPFPPALSAERACHGDIGLRALQQNSLRIEGGLRAARFITTIRQPQRARINCLAPASP